MRNLFLGVIALFSILTTVGLLWPNDCGLVRPDWEKLAYAIGKAEGGRHYGLDKRRFPTVAKAKAGCIRTCKNKWVDWAVEGKREDYLTYLSKRYCPLNSRTWLKNVRYFYEQKT